MTALQAWQLSKEIGGFEIGLAPLGKMLVASGALAGVAYGTWWMLDDALGRTLIAQVVAVGVALTAGTLVYVGAILLARIPEAEQLAARFRRRSAS